MTDSAKTFGGMPQSWQNLWNARYLMYQLIRRDVSVRYKQAVMGIGWAILMPAFIVLSGLMVRTIMSHLSGTPEEAGDTAGLVVKSLPWAFFTGGLGAATNSISGSYSRSYPRCISREKYCPLPRSRSRECDSGGSVIDRAGQGGTGIRRSTSAERQDERSETRTVERQRRVASPTARSR